MRADSIRLLIVIWTNTAWIYVFYPWIYLCVYKSFFCSWILFFISFFSRSCDQNCAPARARPRIYPCIGFWSKQEHHAQCMYWYTPVCYCIFAVIIFSLLHIIILDWIYVCIAHIFSFFSMFSFIFTLFGCWNGGVCNTITLSVRICALSPLFCASRCLVRTGHLMKKCASEWRKVKET